MIYYLIFAILLAGAAYCAYKMSVADFRRRIIPDVYLFPFLLIGLVVVVFFPWVSSIGESVITAAAAYTLGMVVGFIFEKSKRLSRGNDYPPIGLGDIKLLGAGGLWLGPTGLAVAIIAACALGGIWAMRTKQKYIPFAPFFFMGAFIALIGLWFLI